MTTFCWGDIWKDATKRTHHPSASLASRQKASTSLRRSPNCEWSRSTPGCVSNTQWDQIMVVCLTVSDQIMESSCLEAAPRTGSRNLLHSLRPAPTHGMLSCCFPNQGAPNDQSFLWVIFPITLDESGWIRMNVFKLSNCRKARKPETLLYEFDKLKATIIPNNTRWAWWNLFSPHSKKREIENRPLNK